jgi:methionine-rich copper-binding protein CopC
MKRSRMIRVAAVAALLGSALGAAPAALHVRLLRSDPANHAQLRVPPRVISLWFSEAVQLSVTTVRMTGPNGTAVELSAPRMGEGPRAPVVVDVKGQPAMGLQQVTWRTMSRDGHAANGTLSFTLSLASPASRPQGSRR